MAKRFVRSLNGKFKSLTDKSAYSNSIVFNEDERVITSNGIDYGVYGDDWLESGTIGTVRGGKDLVVADKIATTGEHYVEIAHKTITTNIPTVTEKTLAHGGNFTVYYPAEVDNGHVTKLTPVQYTLPGDKDNNTTYSLSSTANNNGATVNLVGSDSTTDTLSITDDNVINVTSSAKTDGATVAVAHAKKGPSAGYTSGNTTTSITAGESKTIKIPQLTVDTYGHVTAGTDESVTITIPADTPHPNNFSFVGLSNGSSSTDYSPKTSNDNLTLAYSTSDDISITGERNDALSLTTLTFSHDDSGVTAGSYGSSAGDTSLSNGEKFKVPYITVNAKGHVTNIADKEFTLSTPNTKVTSVGNHYTPTANDDSKIEITASSTASLTHGSSSVLTGFTVSRDAAGHVTGITATSGKLPADNDTKLTKVDFTAGTATTPTTDTVTVVSSIPDAEGSDGKTVYSTYTTVNVPTKKYVDDMMVSALEFKGELTGTSTSPGGFTPAATKGNVYVVTTAGYVNGVLCEVGDTFMAKDTVSAATSSNYSTIQNSWVVTNTNWNVENKATTIGTTLTTIATIGGKDITAKISHPSSLKNPYSLKVTGGSSDVITYDGSAAKTINVVGTGTTTVTGEDGIITISSSDQYKGTVTKVSTGIGLTGGDITSSGTVKAKLKSETAHTASSATPTNTASRQYAVGIDKDGYLSVNVPWSVVNNGTLTMQVAGVQKQTFTSNQSTAATFNVPSATASDYGVIKVSSVNSSAVTVNSESTTAGRYYPVELNSDGKAIVNVPWTDTSNWTSLNVITNSTTGTTETSSNLTNGNVYLNHVENNTKRSSHKIQGVNGTIVTYNASTDTIEIDWEWEVLA